MQNHRTRRTFSAASAFTLIELLVVVAIIAILAAILFPVFAQARDKARQASCASNEKQLLLAFNMYAQDYDETYPINHSYETGAVIRSWDSALQSYEGFKVATYNTDPLILSCPSDTSPPPNTAQWGSNPVPQVRSYAMPWTSLYKWGMVQQRVTAAGGQYSPGRTLAEIPAPASTIILLETGSGGAVNQANVVGNNAGTYVACPSTCANSPQDIASPGKPRHNGGWNYGFPDGHVKWLKPDQTIGEGKGSPAPTYAAETLANPGGMWTLPDND